MHSTKPFSFCSTPLRIALIAVFLAPSIAVAQTDDEEDGAKVYVNGAITRISDDQFDLDAFTGRLGWNIDDDFGVEAEISLPTGEDNQDFVTFELDRSVAIFATARIEPTDGLEIFARTGLVDSRVNVAIPSQQSTFDVEQRSAAIGAGAKWYFSRNLGIRAGYTYAKSEAIDIGLEWRF